MPRWSKIYEFPDYSVSDHGDVRHDRFERPVAVTQNQRGLLKVGLSLSGKQYQRALAPLVAKNFVRGETDIFNTPIHLDGNQANCRWDNLVWRPRWFAVRYHAQFRERSRHTIDVPMRDLQTGTVYDNSWDVFTTCGLLEHDVVIHTLNDRPVFPTQQGFEILVD